LWQWKRKLSGLHKTYNSATQMTDPSLSKGEPEIFLSKASPKDKPWDDHKVNSVRVSASYNRIGFEGYSKRMWDCAKSLAFALKTDDKGQSKLKLYAAKFCRVRWCPVCQWRKSLMWRARFLKNIPLILNNYPKARFVFLTLTVKNCQVKDLKKTIQSMNKGWQRLAQRKSFPAIGFVKSLEVTKGEDDTAHPHFHCLLMVKPSYFKNNYISQAKWTELWKSCNRLNYTPIVNVKAVKTPKINNGSNLHQQMIKSICETLKYSVKESDLLTDDDWLEELTRQMHKVRSVALGGIFKEYMKEDDPENLIHGEDEEEDLELEDEDVTLIFDWRDLINKYAQRKS
jgi:plasmid rolling circle replication initiator protein Rep